MSFFTSLSLLVNKLCQPSPEAIPDPHSRQIAFNRNKATLPLAVGVGPLYLLLMIWDPSSINQFHMINSFFLIFNALLWLVCCRNYITIFNCYYFVAITAFFPIVVLTYSQNLIFFAYVGALVLPVFFMHLTSSGIFSILSFISQMILLNTIYEAQIREYLGPAAAHATKEIMIAGNFATCVNIFFTFMSYSALKKAHLEISHAKEAKFEQQKSFIFSISHELRNPLNSLLGNIHLALFEPSITEVKRLVGNAHICGEVLLHLVNNILDSGKLEVSGLEVNPTPTNTKEIIENIWSVCSDLIKKKQLNGILKVAKNMPRVLNIDSYRLMQIMLNLVGNAVKFTDRGSVSIQFQWIDDYEIKRSRIKESLPFDDDGVFEKEEKVALISRMKGETDSFYFLSFSKALFDAKVNESLDPAPLKGSLKISVVDTGCGMTQESMGKLFKMFGQVHEDGSKRKVGTGLGLFITKELCKKMNGEVQVYSKPSKGSAFVVNIPIG